MQFQALTDTQITQQRVKYLTPVSTAYIVHAGLKTDAVTHKRLQAAARLTLLLKHSHIIAVTRKHRSA